MTTLTATLAGRAGALFEKPALWILPEPDPVLLELQTRAAVQSLRANARALENMGIETTPSFPEPGAEAPETIAILLPRQAGQARGLMARALELLPPGGTLAVIARNDWGGKRYAALLDAHFGLVFSDGKNRCRSAAVTRPAALPPAVAAWRAEALPRRVAGTELHAAPGHFSCDHVDPGSALLAAHLPPLAGRVADFGAGWGYLSHALLRRDPSPERVDLYEADAGALAMARENLRAFAGRTEFLWRDVTAEPVIAPCDAVVMNPPFHTGRAADPALGQGFIAAAARALKRGGQLWMVANARLPYEDTLAAYFASWRIAAEMGGFKVLLAVK